MHLRNLGVLMLFLALAVASASAADVSGKWKGQITGRDGQVRDVMFDLKAEGDKLTGNYIGGQGRQVAITDGKLEGNDISFVVTLEFGGNTMKLNYRGMVSGDEIKMKVQREGASRVNELTLKRVS